jgi:hypothetical protein
VRANPGHADDDLVPFCEKVINDHAAVGETGSPCGNELLRTLRSGLHDLPTRSVNDEARIDQFVSHREVAPAPPFFEPAADDGHVFLR